MLINETEDASEKQRLKMMQNHRVNIKIKPNRLSLDSINSDFDNLDHQPQDSSSFKSNDHRFQAEISETEFYEDSTKKAKK